MRRGPICKRRCRSPQLPVFRLEPDEAAARLRLSAPRYPSTRVHRCLTGTRLPKLSPVWTRRIALRVRLRPVRHPRRRLLQSGGRRRVVAVASLQAELARVRQLYLQIVGLRQMGLFVHNRLPGSDAQHIDPLRRGQLPERRLGILGGHVGASGGTRQFQHSLR